MNTFITTLFAFLLAIGAGNTMAAKGGKGHGAGGVAEEQASEMGMEKGKRYAGSKEKKVKEGEDENEGEGAAEGEELKKEKKAKKEKKPKKNK